MSMETFGLKYFLSVLALVLIVEGLPHFISPSGIKKWLIMIQQMPDSQLRITGFLSICTGMAILYYALRII